MSYANILTKFRTLLTGLGFTEAKHKFDFDYVPDTVVHKSYSINVTKLVDPTDARDVNKFFYRQLTVQILIAYKCKVFGEVASYDEIPTNWESICLDLEKQTNFPTGVILVDFKGATLNQVSKKEPIYVVSKLDFDCLYRQNYL